MVHATLVCLFDAGYFSSGRLLSWLELVVFVGLVVGLNWVLPLGWLWLKLSIGLSVGWFQLNHLP